MYSTMNIISRIEKIEASLAEIAPNEEPTSPILFRRDENGGVYYHIKKNGKWYWITREECDKYLESFQNINGMIIFMPQKNSE